jgi:hypothetical protein
MKSQLIAKASRVRSDVISTLRNAQPDTPTPLTAGKRPVIGVRLTLHNAVSPAHSGFLAAALASAGGLFRSYAVRPTGGVEPFGQYSLLFCGFATEFYVVARGAASKRYLDALIEAERSFNPAEYDQDGFSRTAAAAASRP